ncbi:RlpA-like double-psi beta-barrel-protein domain-containing protein-containing protein [Pilobolus umbonatus]|nr:RlpA-like double-psi beta-barrel-protein domain-containing protein-containing protein [Pilobolus umbonatus]
MNIHLIVLPRPINTAVFTSLSLLFSLYTSILSISITTLVVPLKMNTQVYLFCLIALFFTLISGVPVPKHDISIEKRGETYEGTATWFKPASEGGSQGACGPEADDNSPIVALNAPQYGNTSKKSSWCGKKITITGPKGTATAIITDACPECGHGDLDLTPMLFEKVVGDMDIGVAPIKWSLA